MLYVNNYIYWDLFNQLYNFDWIVKSIRNTDVVARKLGPVLKRATNHKLEVAKDKWQKKKDMIKKRKVKTMAAKWRRARGEINMSNEEEDESDTRDNTNPN